MRELHHFPLRPGLADPAAAQSLAVRLLNFSQMHALDIALDSSVSYTQSTAVLVVVVE